jgi:hypothetical protein
MSKRIADLSPEMLRRGVVNLDAEFAAAADAIRGRRTVERRWLKIVGCSRR